MQSSLWPVSRVAGSVEEAWQAEVMLALLDNPKMR